MYPYRVQQAIEKIGADGEDIVIINNLLAGGWMNRLPEMVVFQCRQHKEKQQGRFCIVLQHLLLRVHILLDELGSVAEDLGKTQETFNKTKAEDERLSGIIAEKEKLAENVEKAVAERIQKARENAADFIASMFRNSSSSSFAAGLEQWHAAPILYVISSIGIAPMKSLNVLYSARITSLVLYAFQEIDLKTIFLTISSGLFK